MNARLKKELRLQQAPILFNALASVSLAYLIDGSDGFWFTILVFAAFAAQASANSFGAEFDGKTMLQLLSQPISRRQVWFEKLSVLAGTLIVNALVALIAIALLSRGESRPDNWRDVFMVIMGVVVLSFCSGPAISLGVKNSLAAVPMTFLSPLVIWGTFFFLCWAFSFLTSHPDVPMFQGAFQNHPYRCIGLLVLVYSAFYYWLGYRSLMKLQMADTQTQDLKLPTAVEDALGRPLKKILPGYSSPTASLIRKELGVQRISYMIAVFVFALLLVEAVMWEIHRSETTAIVMFLELFLCALTIPFVSAVVSIAEERGWGTAGWQLTLPASPFKQWSVKLSVALATTLLLGIILPIALFAVGKWVLGISLTDVPAGDAGWNMPLWTVLFVGYLASFFLIFFASSVSSNSMRALTFLCGLVVSSGVICGGLAYAFSKVVSNAVLMNFFQASGFRPWTHSHVTLTAYLVLSVTAFWFFALLCLCGRMAYLNFRRGEVDPRRTWQQAIVVVLSISIPALIINSLINLAQSTW